MAFSVTLSLPCIYMCICGVWCVQRPPAYVMRPELTSGLERDDDDELQQRRKQQSESMMAAIERARRRREDDERRIKDEQSISRTKPCHSSERSRQDDKVLYVLAHRLLTLAIGFSL